MQQYIYYSNYFCCCDITYCNRSFFLQWLLFAWLLLLEEQEEEEWTPDLQLMTITMCTTRPCLLLSQHCRPNKNVDSKIHGATEQLGMTSPRDGPLEFQEDYFGLDQFLTEVNEGKKTLEKVVLKSLRKQVLNLQCEMAMKEVQVELALDLKGSTKQHFFFFFSSWAYTVNEKILQLQNKSQILEVVCEGYAFLFVSFMSCFPLEIAEKLSIFLLFVAAMLDVRI